MPVQKKSGNLLKSPHIFFLRFFDYFYSDLFSLFVPSYVFDGFPFTKSQMELMTARKIIPFRVILLNIESTEVVERGALDRLNLPR